MGTNAIYICTEKFAEDKSSPSSYLYDEKQYTEEHWNDDIAGADDSYELSLSYSAYSYRVDLSDYDFSSSKEAKEAAHDYLHENHSDIFDTYDAVVVFDTREPGSGGNAWIEVAGSGWAVGYVAGNGWRYQTGAHELGHIYGGRHGNTDDNSKESTFIFDRYGDHSYTRSLMSVSGRLDCYDTDNSASRGDWYGGCTVSTVHDCIDGETCDM